MKIAVLGWGSLIWSPGNLASEKGTWNNDGPMLPVEFSRITEDGRLTLVIDPGFLEVKVYWKLMALPDLQQARENLQIREHAHSIDEIGFINRIDGSYHIRNDIRFLIERIFAWASDHNFDAVIWTDLRPRFVEKTGWIFNLDHALKYLKSLEGKAFERAREYILKAPEQTTTQYRPALEDFYLTLT